MPPLITWPPPVAIGARVDDPAAGEDERIVRRRVELDVEHAPELIERIADGAVHLRDATERVRVLDLVGGAVMGLLQTAVAQEVAHLGRDGDLPGMRSRQLVGRGEGDVRAEQCLDRLRGRDARGADQAIRVGQEQRGERAHHLGPVEQREPFLRLQLQRLQPGGGQGLARRQDSTAHLDLAPSDQRQGEMGERRQVAGRTEAPLLRHDRVDALFEERQQPIDQQRPAAAVPERQRVRAQEQHRPDDLA